MMDQINVEKIILHILDNSIGMPVLSEEEHPYNREIMEFLEIHIEKVFKDINIKKAFFGPEENPVKNLCIDVSQDNNSFIEKPRNLRNLCII